MSSNNLISTVHVLSFQLLIIIIVGKNSSGVNASSLFIIRLIYSFKSNLNKMLISLPLNNEVKSNKAYLKIKSKSSFRENILVRLVYASTKIQRKRFQLNIRMRICKFNGFNIEIADMQRQISMHKTDR